MLALLLQMGERLDCLIDRGMDGLGKGSRSLGRAELGCSAMGDDKVVISELL